MAYCYDQREHFTHRLTDLDCEEYKLEHVTARPSTAALATEQLTRTIYVCAIQGNLVTANLATEHQEHSRVCYTETNSDFGTPEMQHNTTQHCHKAAIFRYKMSRSCMDLSAGLVWPHHEFRIAVLKGGRECRHAERRRERVAERGRERVVPC